MKAAGKKPLSVAIEELNQSKIRILSEEEGTYLIEAEVFGKGIDIWIRSQGESIIEYTMTTVSTLFNS